MSAPPPLGAASSAPSRRQQIVLPLAAPRKRLLGRNGNHGAVRLYGAELTLFHPAAMVVPLTLAAGQVTVAAVDHGSTDRRSDHGRFPILHRMSATAVIPAEQGIEGWLWTTRKGSALPALVEDEVPNLALVFRKPLEAEAVTEHFRADWVRALAERSPLGTPAVPGLLLAAGSAWQAEDAFRRFGVLNPLTDREVPPVMRRHLPGDRPANPSVAGGSAAAARAQTSIAPPGRR